MRYYIGVEPIAPKGVADEIPTRSKGQPGWPVPRFAQQGDPRSHRKAGGTRRPLYSPVNSQSAPATIDAAPGRAEWALRPRRCDVGKRRRGLHQAGALEGGAS